MLYQLEDRLHLCLRAHKIKYIWSDFHFTVDVKVKILHFRDENKSWWPWFLNCALFGKYFMFFFSQFLLTFYSFSTKSYTFVNYSITYFYFYFHFCLYLGNKCFIDWFEHSSELSCQVYLPKPFIFSLTWNGWYGMTMFYVSKK